MKTLRALLLALLLPALLCATDRPSRIEISVPKAGCDGRYYGRYPLGNNPCTLGVNAVSTSTATGILGSSPGAQVKWHPGHFTESPTRPAVPNSQSRDDSLISQTCAVTNTATSKPAFEGWLISLSWYWVDMTGTTAPVDGQAGGGTLAPGYSSTVYNTSQIDHVLATLASQPAGCQRLIIQMRMDSYASPPTTVPTSQATPYSSGSDGYSGGILPQYIINGISGEGNDGMSRVSPTGIVAAFWRAPVMNAYIAMMQYLAAKYNSNPQVEAVILFGETAQEPLSAPGDYTASAGMTQYASLVTAMKAAWPNTNLIFTGNFPPGWSNANFITSVLNAESAGVGFGGPDTPASSGAGGLSIQALNWGIWIYTGAGTQDGTNWGSTNYSGKVPMSLQQQVGAYTSGVTATQLEAGAFAADVTHEAWEDDSGNGSADVTWSQLTTALQAENYRIANTACPSLYTNGCYTF